MNRYKHPPASDFRNREFDAPYNGPEDKAVIEHITMFGLRKGQTHHELIRQYGTINQARTEEQLKRLVVEGKLSVKGEGDSRFYCP